MSRATWRSDDIWGGPRMGGSRNPNHDTNGLKNSDDLSPTAPSGSAQLNGLSESGPWTSRGFSKPVNQNGQSNGLGSIMRPPGSGGSPTSLRYNAAVGGPAAEERAGSGLHVPSSTSQLVPDAHGSNRRNSADPYFAGVDHNRTGTSSRQPESNALGMTSQFRQARQYSFAQGGQAQLQHQRPSISGPAVSLAPETARGQTLAFSTENIQTNLSESIGRALKLDDTAESLNGYMGNGYSNSTGHPFQPNPSLQAWRDEINNGAGHLGYGTQQDAWMEPPPSYPGVKRGSIERGSPATNSYRPSLSSPRDLTGTPNPRFDQLPRSGPRNAHMSQDPERQQTLFQYPTPPGFFPPFNQYLPNYVEAYPHIPNYRSPAPVANYAGQVNYANGGIRANREKDSSQGARSGLLEEFRSLNKSNRRYELKDLRGYIVEFSGDQHGSRFIQDKLTAANSEEKEHVFREIESNAIQLMKDVFGNYVIQKFFEHGNQLQKKLLAAQMKGKVCDLSVQMYSCRVVQKALEHVLVEQQKEIVEELKSNVVAVAKDGNGNHVVQKVIHMFPKLCIPFIMDAFRGQVERLCSDGYACRVIQRILEHGTDNEKQSLMTDIHACSSRLMTDQYGNYVIQHIIGHGNPEDRTIMIEQAIHRVVTLSRHKYASNVIEKCIQFGSEAERAAIHANFTTQDGDGPSPLQGLVKDQFGNYVIQKLLDCLEGEEKATFAQEVRAVVPQLRRQGNGRQNTALERLISACEAVPPVSVPMRNTNGYTTSIGTAPSTPNLAIEASSPVPTPLLSTEQNSPESSSPPSTSVSTTDDPTEETKKVNGSPAPMVP
ncbi:hypothetical protein ONZ43_g5829 [Nemania bipapillata]|uniref:Uncharacterized protein n=1 Tax=Nemania bipapillata TaxID=110536 RepID=A0ACC2I650_9PEZI|nr:hypothetical protein ONZ43_g5829 [Nemania bipapillata]